MDESKVWFPREQALTRSASGLQDEVFVITYASKGIVYHLCMLSESMRSHVFRCHACGATQPCEINGMK